MYRLFICTAVITLSLTPWGFCGSPSEAIVLATQDVHTLNAVLAKRTRYLDLGNVLEKDRERLRQITFFQCNSLSREAEIIRPREVSPTLLAINIDDYCWTPELWDALVTKGAEPYFHVTLEIPAIAATNGTVGYVSNGQYIQPTAGTPGRPAQRSQAAAPWAPGYAELINCTQSQAPLIRADWFVNQTGMQADRNGRGYYDFLGLGKKEVDFQRLIGADPVRAHELKKETAAAIARSGVTLNNRSIARIPTITGPYWFTQDYKTSKDKQNTVRLLDFSTDPPKGDASEQYGTLPNGLFAFWLQNAAGDRQDSAPDFIASDGQSTTTDRRVHVGVSCIRCHTEGIRPIADHARKLFQGDIKLVSPDYEKLKRLRQLYLSDMPAQVKRDQEDYAAVLKRCNGLTPAANAKAYQTVWQLYDDDLNLQDCARELGCTPEQLTASLKNYGPALDPVLAGLLQTPNISIIRQHWEEVYQTAQIAINKPP